MKFGASEKSGFVQGPMKIEQKHNPKPRTTTIPSQSSINMFFQSDFVLIASFQGFEITINTNTKNEKRKNINLATLLTILSPFAEQKHVPG